VTQAANSIAPEGLRVVAIGGGTGLSTLLRGLKLRVPHPTRPLAPGTPDPLISDLAAVVTVTDDGGSSGRLRKRLQHAAPRRPAQLHGRALSEDEDLLAKLFKPTASAMPETRCKRHNFGNLFVAALTEMTGDFAHAIRLSAEDPRRSRPHLSRHTANNVTRCAHMDDGTDRPRRNQHHRQPPAHRRAHPRSHPAPPPLPETLEAIERANLITVGPGSLYTSLITNLLVDGIPAALAHARGIARLHLQPHDPGQREPHLTASQHIERIYEHTRAPIFDCALDQHRARLRARRRDSLRCRGRRDPIVPDVDRIQALGVPLHHRRLRQPKDERPPPRPRPRHRGAAVSPGPFRRCCRPLILGPCPSDGFFRFAVCSHSPKKCPPPKKWPMTCFE
jgi:uncharacterized cofD-like protein